MNHMYKYSLNELQYRAESLAHDICSPFVVLLQGDLGAGKTTFSQFFLRSILIDKSQSISSPTFNIVNIYDTTKGIVWHVDLYRIETVEEVFNLGLLEFIHQGIAIIEWPELILGYLKDVPYIKITL